MTFGEIFVVIIVALIALKPQDYKPIIKSVKTCYNYLMSFRREIERELELIVDDSGIAEVLADDAASSGIGSGIGKNGAKASRKGAAHKKKDEITDHAKSRMNFYLEKIIELEGSYTGTYNLEDIKSHYHRLLKLRGQ